MTLAELIHGAEKSQRTANSQPTHSQRAHDNLLTIEEFCSRLEVLPYDAKAAQHDGVIRAALEKIGQPIGVNDLRIAGHARSKGLVLVTNKVSEFERVPALEIEIEIENRVADRG